MVRVIVHELSEEALDYIMPYVWEAFDECYGRVDVDDLATMLAGVLEETGMIDASSTSTVCELKKYIRTVSRCFK